MKSKRAIIWGIILTVIGVVGILYNFIFGFEFASRVLAFLTGFVSGVCLGLGSVLLVFNLLIHKE